MHPNEVPNQVTESKSNDELFAITRIQLAQAVMDAVMATMINTTRRIFNPVAAFRIMSPPFLHPSLLFGYVSGAFYFHYTTLSGQRLSTMMRQRSSFGRQKNEAQKCTPSKAYAANAAAVLPYTDSKLDSYRLRKALSWLTQGQNKRAKLI